MIENMLTQDTSYLEEALIENMVEAIRFDIDYHCFWHRIARPEDCQIDYNLYERIQIARDKGHAIYSPQLRRRVFSILFIKGTIRNHELFDIAMDRFKYRLNLCSKSQ